MAGISELLNQVWAEFRKAGITEDLPIILEIGNVLLELIDMSPVTTEHHLSSDLNISEVKEKLLQALALVSDDAGRLLDRYILFRLDEMLRGGRYPTPRHIVEHMLRLAQVGPNDSLADFACGSGGFLVNTDRSGLKSTAGYEISPEWAAIARINSQLHGYANITFTTGNVFREFPKGEMKSFDRILLNPPFGENIDAKLAEKATGLSTSSKSEAAFIALVLKSLVAKGRAAVLVPSGLLRNASEKDLRVHLLNQYTLEAVITYPNEAFQPFSSLTTHLLLIRNEKPTADAMTWFYKAESDGYAAGRGRDLTRDPIKPNDLTCIESLFKAAPKQSNDIDEHLSSRLLAQEDGEGRLLTVPRHDRLMRLRYYPPEENLPELLLLTVQQGSSDQTYIVSPQDSSIIEFTGKLKEGRKMEMWFHNQPDNESLGEALALSTDAKRLLGVCVLQETLKARLYSLDPDQYLKPSAAEAVLASPEEILQSIRSSQHELSRRVERLLGWVLPTSYEHQIPSPLTVGDGTLKEDVLLSALNPEQLAIWEKIQSFTKDIYTRKQPPYPTGRYFIDRDFLVEGQNDVPESVRSTLDILEQMGLIVIVSQRNQRTGDLMPFYRLVEVRDEWQEVPPPDTNGDIQ